MNAAPSAAPELPLRSVRSLATSLLTAILALLIAYVALPRVPLTFCTLALMPITALLIRMGLQSQHQVAIMRWLRFALGDDSDGAQAAESSPAVPAYGVGWNWLLGGLVLLVITLAGLEVMQPHYFTQDDNLVYNPPIVVSCQNLLQTGLFPTWNPYQYMGEPTSNQSDYVLTYPLTYLCYGIARYGVGQPHAFTDVFCILHLLLGYGATYWAARALGLRPSLAALAGLSYALAGCSLIMGRSYFHMTPVLAWMSLLVVSVAWLQKGEVTWRWALFTGCVIGFSCHSGNGQMWCYEVCFFLLAIALLVAAQAVAWRVALWALPTLLLGLAIGAPLIVPQAAFVAGLPRAGSHGGGIAPGLLAMLLPYPLTRAAHPNHWGSTDLQYMGQFYYSGTLFVVVAWLSLLAGAGFVLTCQCDGPLLRRLVARNVWLLCAGVAFDLALGPEGILWPASSVLPLFKWFTGPFKFLLILNLFIVLGAGVVLERVLRNARQSQRWEKGLALGVSGLLLYHAALARPSFYSYADKPYPPLPRPMLDLLRCTGSGAPQRIMPFAPDRSTQPGYLLSLKHALPSVYGIVSVDGYNLFADITPPNRLVTAAFDRNPLTAAHAYGIRWLIVHRLTAQPPPAPGRSLPHGERIKPRQLRIMRILEQKARVSLALPDVTIWELKGSDPLAFAASRPTHPLPLRYSQAGVDVDVTRLSTGGRVVVNVLQRPYMQAAADSQPLPIAADKWGRVVVDVPSGARLLTVRYVPPWRLGFACATVLAVLSALCMLGLTDHKGTKDTKRRRGCRGEGERGCEP